MTLEERLLSRIVKQGSGCWEWQGARRDRGYGMISVLGRMCRVPRVAYELWVGPIPKGKWVLHRCNNPRCCNPAHLYAGTPVQGRAILNELKVGEIKWLLSNSLKSQSEIAKCYGVSRWVIQHIRKGEHWAQVEPIQPTVPS
jgi:hypothetical protein